MSDTEPRLIALVDEHLGSCAQTIADARGCPVGDLMPVADLRADSLDMVEITMALEDEFRIELPDDGASPHWDGEGRPLRELIELVDSKREKGAG